MERPLLARRWTIVVWDQKPAVVVHGHVCTRGHRFGAADPGPVHPARLAGYLGGQIINSGEEKFEKSGEAVCLVVT